MIAIYCNKTFLQIPDVPSYKNEFLLEVDISCNKVKNKIILFGTDLRSNIDCIVYCSEFNFNEVIDENTEGQIASQMIVNYNVYSVNGFFEYHPITILTTGIKISGIIITLPTNNKLFLRELMYLQTPREKLECPVCYETKENVVCVHDQHMFCLDCILKFKQSICPLCRQTIL